MVKAVFSWSGGKDSSYALHKVQQEGAYDVKYLLSTFNGNYHRLSMHGIREELIEAQAAAIGIPLLKVYVYEASNAEYEQQMGAMFRQVKSEGIATVIYGDIFLEDLRKYREEKMFAVGMVCVFPIWKANTAELVQSFISEGFKTITCCINDGYLDESWVGRLIDENFITDLSATVDPCGENGEFHSFCYDGPLFKTPLKISMGEKTHRPLEIKLSDHPTPIPDTDMKGFWFIDLLPAQA
ncbi:MAG: diphthine--ammonia ligase [Chitinophagaceae bacterium]